MKKNWHILFFTFLMLYYFLYYVAFWYVFTDNAFYQNYFAMWYKIFWFMFLPNLVVQIIAIKKKKNMKVCLCFLFLGIFVGIFVHCITVASGV